MSTIYFYLKLRFIQSYVYRFSLRIFFLDDSFVCKFFQSSKSSWCFPIWCRRFHFNLLKLISIIVGVFSIARLLSTVQPPFTSVSIILGWKLLSFLTPRCRTLKVLKVGAFSPYLRVATFWGFEIYIPRNAWPFVILKTFCFFLELFAFCVHHYTRQFLQKSDAKRNDHVLHKWTSLRDFDSFLC